MSISWYSEVVEDGLYRVTRTLDERDPGQAASPPGDAAKDSVKAQCCDTTITWPGEGERLTCDCGRLAWSVAETGDLRFEGPLLSMAGTPLYPLRGIPIEDVAVGHAQEDIRSGDIVAMDPGTGRVRRWRGGEKT
jgi:hypothetical protein